MKWTRWEDLKSDLYEAFGGLFGGCTNQTYSIVECLEFLQSLIKPDEEPFTTFLFRVQWVLKNVVKASEPNRWTPLIFLMGLKEVDQKFVFSLMKETWSTGLTLADDSDVDFMHVLKVVDKDNAEQAVKQEMCQQVWPVSQFFTGSFLGKIIDLPGGQINDPSLGNTFLLRSSQ